MSLAPDAPNPCCWDDGNLTIAEQRPDMVIRRCVVCQCRHFELTVDPGKFGIKVSGPS